MDKITGRFASADVFASHVEDYAASQIRNILDNEVSRGSKVCIMPDCHPGRVGPIGLTMTVTDKAIPQLMGIDIGCGMLVAKIKTKNIEFAKLDKVIRDNVPSGFAIRKAPHNKASFEVISDLRCIRAVNGDKALKSLGTLGGGNHFIEVDKGEDGYYIIIHSGSRHLGVDVADYYTETARRRLCNMGKNVPYEMAYVEGTLMDDYLHDAAITTAYASLNREIILHEILKGMKWKEEDRYESVHNYIGVLPDGTKILRKGAASALEGESVVIPVNMRDGVILGIGKGNPDWNYSAPHGSGRRIKRMEVQNSYTVSAFKKDMKGIYTTCVGTETLDDAPVAYRGLDEILPAVSGTVEVKEVLKPVYNFKAGKER
ncbi:MAG: RtcB family protein [Saccharofermentans sp.]|jgi:RNA-splicing ligase RtcB|nr:RtcB family protein [Saccharofermentans sp.]